MSDAFVYIDQYGLQGSNFYWKSRGKIEVVNDEDLATVGLTNDRVQIHQDIIDVLVDVDKAFQEKGYRMYIKEGYRSKELYNLVYRKRVELYGKEKTDRLLNMQSMPHASGKTVDITLWSPQENKEVYLRNGDDGDDAYFVHFYRTKEDEKSKHYQALQDFMINTMQEHGFRVGSKLEYFHFDYKPDTPKNY